MKMKCLRAAVVLGLDHGRCGHWLRLLDRSSESRECRVVLSTHDRVREDPLRGRRAASRRSRSTTPRPATRSPTSCWASCSRRCGRRRPTTRSASSCSPPRTRRCSPPAPTSAASAADAPTAHKYLGTGGLRRRLQGARRARQALDRRRQRPRARRLARHRARLRPDHRQGQRRLRHARDQRRPVPVHDHGADLPQRAAQEDDRDAAARRAADGRGGARGGDRQQGRRRRRSSTPRSPSGRGSWPRSRRW